MNKLFNVVENMQGMNLAQLQGAVRNMENVANLVYVAYSALIEQSVSNTSVLGTKFEDMPDSVEEFYLPAVDGGTVIIKKNRPDMLIKWKMEFFNAFDNLELDVTSAPQNSVHFIVDTSAIPHSAHHLQAYQAAQREHSRSGAALYESMSKKTKF